MIKIEGLTILFESFRIMDLNIRIEEREFHSLLGQRMWKDIDPRIDYGPP